MNASSSLRTTVSTCPLPRGWHLRALGAERRAVRGAGLLRLRRAAREVVPERAVRAKGAEHQVLVQDLLACLSACHAHVRAQHTGDRVGHRGWVNNTAGARRSPTTPCWPVLGRASLRRTGPPLCQRQGYRVWRPGLAWCKTMHDLADAGQHAPPRPPEGGTRSAQSPPSAGAAHGAPDPHAAPADSAPSKGTARASPEHDPLSHESPPDKEGPASHTHTLPATMTLVPDLQRQTITPRTRKATLLSPIDTGTPTASLSPRSSPASSQRRRRPRGSVSYIPSQGQRASSSPLPSPGELEVSATRSASLQEPLGTSEAVSYTHLTLPTTA